MIKNKSQEPQETDEGKTTTTTTTQQNTHSQLPITPQAQSVSIFPQLTKTRSRRYSRENSAICSSSSSLYDTNINFDDRYQDDCITKNGFSFAYSSDDHNYDNSDDDETDTDIDLEIAGRSNSIRKSQELFNRNDLWDISNTGIKSPTYNNKTAKSLINNEYFSSPVSENTPIFKRLVSRNSLKPQLKSFRRITSELFHESVPFEDEIHHEKLILLTLNDGVNDNINPLLKLEEEDTSKKIDIIKKANESWNMKKHSNLFVKSKLKESITSDELDESADLDSLASSSSNNEQAMTPQPVRKRSYDNDEFTTPNTKSSSSSSYNTKFKRRAVSSSPISASIFKRGSIRLISNTSKELENMRLD